MGASLGCEYVDCFYPNEGDGVIRVEYSIVPCKYCGSTTGILRFGTYKGTQRFWCKKCQRKFADNQAVPGMRTPTDQVGMALLDFYSGDSLNDIRTRLTQQFQNSPSDSSIYGWITRFSKVAIDRTKSLQPKVGDVWLADETVVRIGGRNVWFWDIIDRDSRYLLASHISRTRTIKDAQALMQEAYECAGKAPKKILTDKLAAYIDGIELTFGSDTRHVQTNPFVGGDETTNIIERFHGTLKERTKIIRWFGNLETAKVLTEGWLCHYNFCKEHTTLGDVPPAQKTGGKVPFTNWSEVVTGKQATRVSEADFTRMERGEPVAHDSVKPSRVRRRKPAILKHKTYHEASLARLRP